jgi:hypothetical protein
MNDRKPTGMKIRVWATILSLGVLLPPVMGAEKEWIVFQDNLSKDLQRINFKLEFSPSSAPFYDAYQHSIKSEKLAEEQDGYPYQMDLGTLIDGNPYKVLIKDTADMNIISEHSERLFTIRVIRLRENQEPETVKEGILPMGNDLVIPLEVSPEKLGIPFKGPVKGSMRIAVSGNSFPGYEGRCQTTLTGILSGTTSTDQAFLRASMTCGESLELKNRHLNLVVEPLGDKRNSIACVGKVSEPLTLRSAKFFVEKIASDSSELVLVLVDGTLVQEIKPDEPILTVGKPFPGFARVDLVRRELVSLDGLRKEAGDDGYVVLIFGDLKMAPQPFYGGQPPMRNLPFDETMISDILKKDCEKSLVIGFVCQQLPLVFLYEKWLGRDPEFHVLSDFSNPLDMQFIGIRTEPGMYRPPYDRERGETLRGNLKLENQKVVTALIDANGGLVYLNPDAGTELAKSLAQINTLIKEGKTADNQQ